MCRYLKGIGLMFIIVILIIIFEYVVDIGNDI